ncbi:MAG: helix-turn-helix domain-containing protein [Lachnospiraceae bacterium]
MEIFPFPGRTYKRNMQTAHTMLTILAGGRIATPASFHGTPEFSSSTMLLYTVCGKGRIAFPEEDSIVVSAGTFLWHSCDSDTLVQKLTDNWDFYVFFLQDFPASTAPFPAFFPHHIFVQVPKNNPLLQHLDLLCENDASATLESKIRDHQLLTSVFCEALLLLPDLNSGYTPPETYLTQLKEILDTDYASPHSLAEFEKLFAISRYHLCREFSKCYGEPPLQYLNRQRIKKSMELLRKTDINIREVGATVGIENTNHFINLFKKYVGCTPLAYRKRMLKQKETR